MRFALELARGDPVRPFALGLSEAQWWCLVTALACALAWRTWWTFAAFGLVAAGAAWLVARRRARELVQPPHLHELDGIAHAVLRDPQHARRDSSLGVGISCRYLPDGRIDWILSSSHRAWTPASIAAITDALWPAAERVAGHSPGVMHVLDNNHAVDQVG
jgi:hypothetical protein